MTNFFKDQFEEDDFMLEESAQIWRYGRRREFLVRIRRLVDNALKVDRIPMRHEQPLRYDWLHISGLLPEALEACGNRVVNQVAVLLQRSTARARKPARLLGNTRTPSRSTANTSRPSA